MTIASIALAESSPNPLLVAEGSEEHLARAFVSFSSAAASLERTYSYLQAEVSRLRRELEQTNRELVSSLEENRRTGERLHAILEGLPCAVLVAGDDGAVWLANPEAERLLSAQSHSPLPKPVRELLARVPSEGDEFEWRMDESIRWLTVRRAELNGDGSIFILQDVTGLRKLQREYEVLRRQQALAEMSGVLAHEVRNPLGSLELFAGVLAESELNEQQRHWVEYLQAGIRMLAATVNNVLHFHSRPRPGFVRTDLGQLLQSLTEFLRPLAERARVQVMSDPGLDGVNVAADRDRLQQVVLNLALNSFHFMADGGRLKIAGVIDQGKVCLAIEDSGPGIAAENLERIFEPGFTTRAGSPGLGLAVCKTIMEQHRGAIRVSSRRGRGTTFTLEIPLWREP